MPTTGSTCTGNITLVISGAFSSSRPVDLLSAFGEREPGQIADHHEHHKTGLPELFRRAHLKDVAEHEGVNDDVNYGRQE